jgi:hypothetical protein
MSNRWGTTTRGACATSGSFSAAIGGDKEPTAASVKAGQLTSQSLRRPARASVAYRIARWVEAYAFTATPERIGVQEGLRAATAVSVIVAAAVWLHWPSLSWAAFGAFWTCLADPGGSYRSRLACMATFATAGAVAAWVASASAGVSPRRRRSAALDLLAQPE